MRTSAAYLAGAALCLALHNIVLISAHYAGRPLWAAVLLSFVIVAVTGYVYHALFTFRHAISLKGLIRYAAAMSANIPLAYLATWFWGDIISLPMWMAAPIASICMVAINFLLSKWAITAPDDTFVAGR